MAVASTGARYFIGSGYLIAPGLLLTAQHVLSPDYEPLRSDTLSACAEITCGYRF